MKAYKIDLSMYEGKVREVISEAVQKKAFELGYAWGNDPREVHFANEPLLFIPGCDGFISWENNAEYFKKHKNTAITAADFLALTTAKDEPTFKPFDKVLVRDGRGDEWCPAFFWEVAADGRHREMTGDCWDNCIPYEGNEHLLGTTEEAK